MSNIRALVTFPTLVEGADGGLVGLAGFVPDFVVSLVKAILEEDLNGARKVYDGVYVVTKMVYRFGEPSGSAHQRSMEWSQ